MADDRRGGSGPRPGRGRGDGTGRGKAGPTGGRGRGTGREDVEAKPWRPPATPRPAKPPLPELRPSLPRGVWRELKSSAPPGMSEDVGRALGAAGVALEEGDEARALELLTWAKSVAPRSAAVREALGIVLYAAARYGQAHSELLTYRRLSGRQDQNHLLADCARALGRPEKMTEYVEAMVAAAVEPERVVEGLMVQAGERADRGDLDGALEVLRTAGLEDDRVEPWHPRLWYMAGDLCERLGRTTEARDFFEAILAVEDEFGDVDARLAALD